MKYKYLILTFIILFYSCKVNKDIGSTKDVYILAYKKAVLYECINSATNGNLYKFSRENNDLGTAPQVAIIYHSDVKSAKILGASLSTKIKKINYSDYQNKKPIFSDCVGFAFSKYVDSIARNRYKKLLKTELEYIYE